ncbi:MAG: PilZ domain-containing protein [Phycisphaeraceae bacterium]|jgi:hypothetical protein|nr:PilZ domain-containing protein [Phycisphaeraceae bacterium]
MSSMPAKPLTLVDHAEQDVIPFERRAVPRFSAAGRVTAVHCETTQDGRQNHICSLLLHDISDLGVGATSQEPIEQGSTITLFFPPHGPERGFDVYGEVVRCRHNQETHEIGIRLTGKTAA